MSRLFRRYYLLLEVLIALALISLCALPLMRTHTELARADFEALLALQLELCAEKAFAELRVKLYQHNPGADAITKRKVAKGELSRLSVKRDPKKGAVEITPTYEIELVEEKKKGNRAIFRLYQIAIGFREFDKTYEYNLFAIKDLYHETPRDIS